MKRTLLTIGISVVTTLLTMTGVLWWLVMHPISLPSSTDKGGTVVQSRLRLDRGLVESTIYRKDYGIPMTRSLYFFDRENSVVFDNHRDRSHHRLTVQTRPLPGTLICKTYNPDEAATDQPLYWHIFTNYGSPNQTKRFFDGAGTEISAQQYDTLIAAGQ